VRVPSRQWDRAAPAARAPGRARLLERDGFRVRLTGPGRREMLRHPGGQPESRSNDGTAHRCVTGQGGSARRVWRGQARGRARGFAGGSRVVRHLARHRGPARGQPSRDAFAHRDATCVVGRSAILAALSRVATRDHADGFSLRGNSIFAELAAALCAGALIDLRRSARDPAGASPRSRRKSASLPSSLRRCGRK
jgi:hypothetical protein